MFGERMALEANLRREKLTSEARTYQRLRPYRRAPRWQGVAVFTFGGMAGGKGDCSRAALSTGRGRAGSGRLCET